jgi:hypothetical protein
MDADDTKPTRCRCPIGVHLRLIAFRRYFFHGGVSGSIASNSPTSFAS